jgi:hypothetical protein
METMIFLLAIFGMRVGIWVIRIGKSASYGRGRR